MQHKKTCFVFRHSLFHSKPYLKKWVCPDNLIYYTTDVYPPHPPFLWRIIFHWISTNFFTPFTYFYLCALIFICENLFLSVRTYSHLSESLFICQNLFSSVCTYFRLWESLLVYDHLWESLLIYDHMWESIFLKSLWKKASVWTPSSKTNLLSSKHDNDILVISYFPILCFLLWILLILCFVICLFNIMLVHSSN